MEIKCIILGFGQLKVHPLNGRLGRSVNQSECCGKDKINVSQESNYGHPNRSKPLYCRSCFGSSGCAWKLKNKLKLYYQTNRVCSILKTLYLILVLKAWKRYDEINVIRKRARKKFLLFLSIRTINLKKNSPAWETNGRSTSKRNTPPLLEPKGPLTWDKMRQTWQ
jgi:hypothetical protein